MLNLHSLRMKGSQIHTNLFIMRWIQAEKGCEQIAHSLFLQKFKESF